MIKNVETVEIAETEETEEMVLTEDLKKKQLLTDSLTHLLTDNLKARDASTSKKKTTLPDVVSLILYNHHSITFQSSCLSDNTVSGSDGSFNLSLAPSLGVSC